MENNNPGTQQEQPQIISPNVIPPSTGQIESKPGTQTFLIEASRADSLIDGGDNTPGAKWTSGCNFNLRRGDRISVEMCAFNAENAGEGAPVIELTGERALGKGGKAKSWTDNKVLMEICFYMNNNNTYTVGLPLKHPNGKTADAATEWNYINIPGIDGLAGTSAISLTNPVQNFEDNVNTNLFTPIFETATTDNQNAHATMNGIGFITPWRFGAGTGANPYIIKWTPGDVFSYTVAAWNIAADYTDPPNYVDFLPAGVATPVVGVVFKNTGTFSPAYGYPCTYREGYVQGRSLNVSTAAAGNYQFAGLNGMKFCQVDNGGGTPYVPPLQILPNNNKIVDGFEEAVVNIREALIQGVITTANHIEIQFAVTQQVIPENDCSGNECFGAFYGATRQDFQSEQDIPSWQQEVGMANLSNIWTTSTADIGYRDGGGIFQIYNAHNIGDTTGYGAPNNYFPGAVGAAAYQRMYNFAGEINDGSANLVPSLFYGAEGYRTTNIIKENNNKPYILTRNDFMGMGRIKRNGTGQCPRLKPQTAFILLDADELFTDLQTLANRINDILHEKLPVMGLENDNYNEYILNQDDNPDDGIYQKGSSVIPYVTTQGYYDQTKYDTPGFFYDPRFDTSWDNIPKLSIGGTVKCQPANFQTGEDKPRIYVGKTITKRTGYLGTEPGKLPLEEVQEWNEGYRNEQANTYLSSIKEPASNPQRHCNTLYGNMLVEDMAKMMIGDNLFRLPLGQMNRPEGAIDYSSNIVGATDILAIAEMGQPMMLNTKLQYIDVNVDNGNHTLKSTKLPRGSLIYTNIDWLGSGKASDWKDNGEPYLSTIAAGVNRNYAYDFQQLAEALKRAEIYTPPPEDVLSYGSAPTNNITEQEADTLNWSVTIDLGVTNDNKTSEMRPIPSATNSSAAPAANRTQIGMKTNVSPLQFISQECYPQCANPNFAPGAAGDYLTPALGGNPYGTGWRLWSDLYPTDPKPADFIEREIICPIWSNSAFGSTQTNGTFDWSADYKVLKPLGRLQIRSRFTENWNEVIGGTPLGSEGYDYKYISTIESQTIDIATGLPVWVDEMCGNGIMLSPDSGYLTGNVPGFSGTKGSVDFMRKYDLPFVPYLYRDPSGVTNEVQIKCAYVVQRDYTAETNNLSSWELGCMTWGMPVAVSPSFFDNHAIAPMNGDNINFRNRLVAKTGGATESFNPINPDTNLTKNNFNYVWLGAANPTFQFNGEKNRMEILNFQEDNYYSEFQSEANASGGGSGAQQGVKCALINVSTRDAKFSNCDPQAYTWNSVFPSATNPPTLGNVIGCPNQGIRDAISGIGVWNVWLCPPDYEFPENINPVSYWDNSYKANISPVYGEYDSMAKTEDNWKAITKGCTRATREYWEGNLLDKLGFTAEQVCDQYYGNQEARFDPNTYNNTEIDVIGQGQKPYLGGNSFDNTQNPFMNINYKNYGANPPTSTQTDYNGLPKFQNGLANNQAVALTTQSYPLTAANSITLSTSPFFLIYSDICETNYQSGATPQPALFYCMRNYPNQGYFYGSGSTFYHMVNQDRCLSSISTEVRNPATGELASLSPNSVIMYKIERDIVAPPPSVDALGQPIEQPTQPDPNTSLLNSILQTDKEILEEGESRAQGNFPGGVSGSGGGASGQPNRPRHSHMNFTINNTTVQGNGGGIQQAQQQRNNPPPDNIAPAQVIAGQIVQVEPGGEVIQVNMPEQQELNNIRAEGMGRRYGQSQGAQDVVRRQREAQAQAQAQLYERDEAGNLMKMGFYAAAIADGGVFEPFTQPYYDMLYDMNARYNLRVELTGETDPQWEQFIQSVADEQETERAEQQFARMDMRDEDRDAGDGRTYGRQGLINPRAPPAEEKEDAPEEESKDDPGYAHHYTPDERRAQLWMQSALGLVIMGIMSKLPMRRNEQGQIVNDQNTVLNQEEILDIFEQAFQESFADEMDTSRMGRNANVLSAPNLIGNTLWEIYNSGGSAEERNMRLLEEVGAGYNFGNRGQRLQREGQGRPNEAYLYVPRDDAEELARTILERTSSMRINGNEDWRTGGMGDNLTRGEYTSILRRDVRDWVEEQVQTQSIGFVTPASGRDRLETYYPLSLTGGVVQARLASGDRTSEFINSVPGFSHQEARRERVRQGGEERTPEEQTAPTRRQTEVTRSRVPRGQEARGGAGREEDKKPASETASTMTRQSSVQSGHSTSSYRSNESERHRSMRRAAERRHRERQSERQREAYERQQMSMHDKK